MCWREGASLTQHIAECTAKVISDPWNDSTTRMSDIWQLARAWKDCAREGKLRATDEALVFEEWTIPYQDIDEAVLTRLRDLYSTYYLRIRVKGEPYQFGIMKGGSGFSERLPLEVRRVELPTHYFRNQLLTLVVLITSFVVWLIQKKK